MTEKEITKESSRKEIKDFFINELNLMLREIRRGTENTASHLREGKEKFSDESDIASYESLEGLSLRFNERQEKLEQKVIDALKRIEEGQYFECEECGEEIGFSRLKARPVTTFCVKCKELQEKQEKANEE